MILWLPWELICGGKSWTGTLVFFMDNPLNTGLVIRADFFHRRFKNSVFQGSQIFAVWSMEGRSVCIIPCRGMGAGPGDQTWNFWLWRSSSCPWELPGPSQEQGVAGASSRGWQMATLNVVTTTLSWDAAKRLSHKVIWQLCHESLFLALLWRVWLQENSGTEWKWWASNEMGAFHAVGMWYSLFSTFLVDLTGNMQKVLGWQMFGREDSLVRKRSFSCRFVCS